MSKILIVDDDDYVLKSLARLLRTPEYEISCYNDPEEALTQCGLQKFDLILSDQRMPAMEGTEFFTHVAQLFPLTRRILISGYSDFSNVTEAFNDGIIHKFVIKPWDNEPLRNLISEELRIADQNAATNEHDDGGRSQGITDTVSGKNREQSSGGFHGLISSNNSMSEQISIIRSTANSDAPFFIHGETGTGKELVAKSIHLESDRKDEKFLALNCANLTETLLESQLFGHTKGAFTGAQKDQKGLLAEAEGGTLFLDEVTEISLNLQAKLLRVLQEREYTPVGEAKAIPFDVKLVSASSTKLETAVANGDFREDLRYRLEVLPINLPPLRARGDDIRILFEHFLAQQYKRHGKNLRPIDQSVYDRIQEYNWPGNVRELVNVCTYVAALANDEQESISLKHLPVVLGSSELNTSNSHTESEVNASIGNIKKRTKNISEASLMAAIENFDGHRESMASYFGISRMTLWRKMKQYNLDD